MNFRFSNAARNLAGEHQMLDKELSRKSEIENSGRANI